MSLEINIVPGNGLMSSGTKPLPEPILSQFCVAIWSLGHTKLNYHIAQNRSKDSRCVIISIYYGDIMFVLNSYPLWIYPTSNKKPLIFYSMYRYWRWS